MKNSLLKILFLLFLSVLIIPSVYAKENKINKFGIHLAQPSDKDLDYADELVNSNGGKWGYVTIVIHEDDMNKDKWQDVFDKLREKNLIPIIRLASIPDGSNWKRPDTKKINNWVSFLNSLNWVVKNRYIVLFNEPNHATEWGGAVDPVSFGKINLELAKKLKNSNVDYFVMMGGMDASAPQSPPNYMDSAVFLRETIDEIGVDNFNLYFDGLASHSYPNPGFSGAPSATGKTTVRGYEWEIEFLQSLGVKKLPVFITETGWNGDAISRTQIAQNFKYAYENIWLPDDRVFAVTPFILNYQGEPFLKFSWVKPGESEVYREFEEVKALAKEKGNPEIIESGSIFFNLPKKIVENSTYHFQISIKNLGQAIWSKDNDYAIAMDPVSESHYLSSSIGNVKPGDTRVVDFYFSTDNPTKKTKAKFVLKQDGENVIISKDWEYEVVAFPSLDMKISLFPKIRKMSSDGFEIQIFDKYEQLVFKKSDIKLDKNKAVLDKVENVALGEKYRVVVLKDYYLPRQNYVVFKDKSNSIKFEPMLPFDFSKDGKFGLKDIPAFFQNIKQITNLLPF